MTHASCKGQYQIYTRINILAMCTEASFGTVIHCITCTCTHAYIHVTYIAHVHMYTRIYVKTYMHVHVHTCMVVSVQHDSVTYIHSSIHKHTKHTYRQANIHGCLNSTSVHVHIHKCIDTYMDTHVQHYRFTHAKTNLHVYSSSNRKLVPQTFTIELVSDYFCT